MIAFKYQDSEAGAITSLNAPLVAGGGGSTGFEISPDSSRVVYRGVQDSNFVFELYSVALAGGHGLAGRAVDGHPNSQRLGKK